MNFLDGFFLLFRIKKWEQSTQDTVSNDNDPDMIERLHEARSEESNLSSDAGTCDGGTPEENAAKCDAIYCDVTDGTDPISKKMEDILEDDNLDNNVIFHSDCGEPGNWPDGWEKEWIVDYSDNNSNTDDNQPASDLDRASTERIGDNPPFYSAVDTETLSDDLPTCPCDQTNFSVENEIHPQGAAAASTVNKNDDYDTSTSDESSRRSNSSLSNSLSNGHIPNGVLLLSPNGDVFAKPVNPAKTVHFAGKNPQGPAQFRNFTNTLPQSMKSLPLKEVPRVRSKVRRHPGLHRQEELKSLEDLDVDEMSKEELLVMWKNSETELTKQLKKALNDKAELEHKLASIRTETYI